MPYGMKSDSGLQRTACKQQNHHQIETKERITNAQIPLISDLRNRNETGSTCGHYGEKSQQGKLLLKRSWAFHAGD